MNRSMNIACASFVIAGVAAALGCGSKSDAAAGAAGAGGGKGGGKGKLEFAVEVAPVELRQVGYVVTAPGAIQAFEQVQVTARVGGAVDKVLFSEGQTVGAGQALAIIEVDRYKAAVDQAKATVDKVSAGEAQAESQLARRQASNKEHPGLIAGEEVATFETAVQTAKADVRAATEAVKVAQLNLRDAQVRAPIAGIIQTRTVETGQYLQPGTVLATLLQRDPLLLKLQVTEQDAPRIKPGMIANLALRESTRTYAAKITLVSGSADPTSHLISVTGQIDDKDHQYWLRPGAFCDVSIPVGAARQAAVVPEIAIRATERGFLAYVVQGTTAKERVVQLGMHTSNGLVEVTQGLAAGDLLVVLGGEPLSDGAPVKIAQHTTMSAFDASDAGTPAPSPAASGEGAPTPAPSASGAPAASAGGTKRGHARNDDDGGAP